MEYHVLWKNHPACLETRKVCKTMIGAIGVAIRLWLCGFKHRVEIHPVAQAASFR